MDIMIYIVFIAMSLYMYGIYSRTKPEMAYLGVFAGLVFIVMGIMLATCQPIDKTFCFAVGSAAHCEVVDLHTECDIVTGIGIIMMIVGMGACVDVVSFHCEGKKEDEDKIEGY